MRLFLTTLALFLSLTTYANDNLEPEDTIFVTGVGEVEAEPDQATLTVRVSAQEPSLPEAKTLADQRYSQVLDVIKEFNIDKKDVKATQIIAQPQHEWRNNKQVYRGELVSRTLQITVNKLDQLPELMQALVENEVSTIDGMTTGFQDPEALMEQALGEAAENAKSKAEFLAKKLDRKLGSAYSIKEFNETVRHRGFNGSVVMERAMAADSYAAPEEMHGTQAIKARVSVRFHLL